MAGGSPRRWSWWLGLLLSAGAHVLVGVCLYLLPPERPSVVGADVAEPVEIEVAEPPPEPAAPAIVPAPRAAAPRRDPLVKAAPRPEIGGVAQSDEAVVTDGNARPGSDAPSVSPPSPDLSLGTLSHSVLNQLAGPAPEGAMIAPAPSLRRPSVDELRVAEERRQDAFANVAVGRADPILYDYLRGARARFEEGAHKLAAAIAMGPDETVGSWKRGYLQRVDEVNRQRAAADEPSPSDAWGTSSQRGERPTDVLRAYNEATRQAAGGAEQRTVEVCLELAAGKAPVAKVRKESGVAALDQLAVDSFARAVAARPPSPELHTGAACYEVGISAFRIPPLPVFGCGIDGGGVRCVWPFKKVTSVTGHLIGVDTQTSDGAKTERSLLRRPH